MWSLEKEIGKHSYDVRIWPPERPGWKVQCGQWVTPSADDDEYPQDTDYIRDDADAITCETLEEALAQMPPEMAMRYAQDLRDEIGEQAQVFQDQLDKWLADAELGDPDLPNGTSVLINLDDYDPFHGEVLGRSGFRFLVKESGCSLVHTLRREQLTIL